MVRSRRWNIAAERPEAAALASNLKISPLIAQILLNRGLSEPDACRSFLQPSLKHLHDPALIPNLTRASERIARAISDHEKIVIYGDYDVDGITATSILWHALTTLGADVHTYIPHRIDEGYGLNGEAIEELANGGAKLIVTVDCGVTALKPADVARTRGVDLIITDHHEGKESPDGPMLPDCFALVHPRLAGDGPAYPNPHLCGAGVAFKLAWGVGQAVNGAAKVSDTFREFLMEATALAALGTIADVVPLIGENRILAAFGLGLLKRSKLRGIRALIASAGLDGQTLDAYHVGFLLGPRLNASGRMGHAHLAVEMLTTADDARANEIATFLEQQNRSRQTIERQTVVEAMDQATQLGYASDDVRGIVLGKEGWHPGVIGIVASRMVERFAKPVVMVAMSEGMGSGSGRSIAGFHLARALQACTHTLESHGGHEMAAGLKLRTEKFDAFRDAFTAHANEVLTPADLVPEIKLECLTDLKNVTRALVDDLKRLGPFGCGNRKPLLACRGVTLSAPARRVGKTGDHLQLFVRHGQVQMKCIAFNTGALFDRLKPGMSLDLAVDPTLNEYNGMTSVELDVKDIAIVETT